VDKVKLMFVFGTRPEAIKLAPVVLEARRRFDRFETTVIATGQHRQMLDDVLSAFDIVPDCDFNVMTTSQSLFHISSQILSRMESILADVSPDIVLVQGDTTTTMCAALSGFYAGKHVAHIEAGLRTGQKWNPFPEEVNRRVASVVADDHFAPTLSARDNLLREGVSDDRIHVTGNTVIDALLWMVQNQPTVDGLPDSLKKIASGFSRIVLVTGHRRESFGQPIRRILATLKNLAKELADVAFVYPAHLNPEVQSPVAEILTDLPNFFLMPPLSYPVFCWLMNRCDVIVTDSGGIQEEAPALRKPVLVTRRETERPEAVQEGLAILVGSDEKKLSEGLRKLLSEPQYYRSMAKGVSPYGDGLASERILDILQKFDRKKSE